MITELVVVPEPEASDDEDEAEVEEKLALLNRIVAIIGQRTGSACRCKGGADRRRDVDRQPRDLHVGYSTARNIGIACMCCGSASA